MKKSERFKLSAACLAAAMLSGGCAGVYTPKLSAISWGLDSSQILSGLNVTRWQTPGTNDYYEIILDSSSGQQSSGKLIDGLIAIGEIAARAKTGAAPAPDTAAPAAAGGPDLTDLSDDSDDSSDREPAKGYAGKPGASGEGVYGRPSCSRCRAYLAAHPEAEIIDIDSAGNRADMWAALRLRGYAGQSVSLPVSITADGYTQAAR